MTITTKSGDSWQQPKDSDVIGRAFQKGNMKVGGRKGGERQECEGIFGNCEMDIHLVSRVSVS